jgi:integrase
MPDNESLTLESPRRMPWNKGKLIGAKPPLRPKHVWAIRTRLMIEGRTRDLAMFNLAIDSKLRGCDVLGLKVDDIAPHGYTVDRATVRQSKTGRPVKFELTEQTRQAVDGTCATRIGSRANFCSRAVAGSAGAWGRLSRASHGVGSALPGIWTKKRAEESPWGATVPYR